MNATKSLLTTTLLAAAASLSFAQTAAPAASAPAPAAAASAGADMHGAKSEHQAKHKAAHTNMKKHAAAAPKSTDTTAPKPAQ